MTPEIPYCVIKEVFKRITCGGPQNDTHIEAYPTGRFWIWYMVDLILFKKKRENTSCVRNKLVAVPSLLKFAINRKVQMTCNQLWRIQKTLLFLHFVACKLWDLLFIFFALFFNFATSSPPKSIFFCFCFLEI